jgi:hypothetical protein
MKIIITEEQLNLLIEGSNPCPKGVVVNKTVTVDDLNKGVKISKGYCDPKSNSGLVKVQTLLKNKGYLGPNDPVGYFGDKTLSAICKLWGLTSCDSSVKLGKKTLDKLQGKSTEQKSSNFNKLTPAEQVLVTTLIGEAGGESNAKQAMTAVANVLRNRAKSDFLGFGTTPKDQALARKQFSMWNSHTVNGKPRSYVVDIYKIKNHTQLDTAINIVKNIDSLTDITGGAKYYYTGSDPYWVKDPGPDSTWVKKAKIGSHVFGNIVKNKKNK